MSVMWLVYSYKDECQPTLIVYFDNGIIRELSVLISFNGRIIRALWDQV